jgi:hypothetical protein
MCCKTYHSDVRNRVHMQLIVACSLRVVVCTIITLIPWWLSKHHLKPITEHIVTV